MISPCLPPEDAVLFYELWYSILRFVNEKKKLYPGILLDRPYQDNQRAAKEISDLLWEAPSLFNEFLAASPYLSPENQQIVKGFKRFVKDTFVAERHLKSGTILIDSWGVDAYLVKGITVSLKDELDTQLPVYVNTVLLPFKRKIITYGFMSPFGFFMGPRFKKQMNETYRQIREAGGVLKFM